MKLTLEQKAFYEYGRAVESLKRTIYETRETAIQEFKDPYRLLSTYDRKQLIDAMGLASEISAVRQKRAACRMWKLPAQRHCQNCCYYEKSGNDAPCVDCTLGDIGDDTRLSCNWAPRRKFKKGDIVRRIDTGKMRVCDDHIPFGKLVTVLKDETDDDRGNILVGTRETTQAVKFYEVKLFLKKVND